MQVVKHRDFTRWLNSLRDTEVRLRVQRRLDRAALTGSLGVTRSMGDGLQEMKLFGPGYRVYYAIHEGAILYLLGGGDKDSQADDIRRARELLRRVKEAGWMLN